MFKNKIVILLASSLLLGSCGYMVRQMATPNSCKKCEITNDFGTVVWTEDDCGGGVYNMEQRAKAEAYDKGCGFKVSCSTYKKEVTED